MRPHRNGTERCNHANLFYIIYLDLIIEECFGMSIINVLFVYMELHFDMFKAPPPLSLSLALSFSDAFCMYFDFELIIYFSYCVIILYIVAHMQSDNGFVANATCWLYPGCK